MCSGIHQVIFVGVNKCKVIHVTIPLMVHEQHVTWLHGYRGRRLTSVFLDERQRMVLFT